VQNGLLDPFAILTQQEPMTNVISAYKAFDTRQPGWLKAFDTWQPGWLKVEIVPSPFQPPFRLIGRGATPAPRL